MSFDSNVILTHDPMIQGYTAYGVQSYGPEEIISHNLIVSPVALRFWGICVRTYGAWIEDNTILPWQILHQSYTSPNRSVGIGIGNGSTGSTSVANHTYGLDVGIGPEPFQTPPHRVIYHFSTDDVLAVDPFGLTPDSLPGGN